MKSEDLEVLITLDDPGEDTLEEDNFHQRQNGTDSSTWRIAEGGDDE